MAEQETFLDWQPTKPLADEEARRQAAVLVEKKLQNQYGVSVRRQGAGYAVYLTKY